MKRLAPLLLALAGCSTGDSPESGPSALDLAQSCTGSSVAHLARVVEALGTLVANPPPGAAFTVGLDLDYDGTDDTTLEGTFDGSRAVFSITGALNGTADLRLGLPATDTIEATGGTIDIDDGTCRAVFAPNTLTFVFGSPLAAVVHGITVSGLTGATITTTGAVLDGPVAISADTQQASFDGTLNGTSTRFAFDVFPSPARLAELSACVVAQDVLFREVDLALTQLAEIVAAADGDVGDLPDTPGLETAPEPNPSILNYRMQLADFGDVLEEGTIVGQVRVSRLNFVLTILVSWFVDSRNTNGGLVSGKSDRFLEFVYDGGTLRDKQGAGALAEPGCDGGFDVDPGDPLPPDNAGGTITFRATVGGDTMLATFRGGFATQATSVSVNGIFLDPTTAPFN
ncbi:MAG: hypothetical protein ACYTGN_04210 [Planctomycetota bacterium]|jgi:hypothetical protein